MNNNNINVANNGKTDRPSKTGDVVNAAEPLAGGEMLEFYLRDWTAEKLVQTFQDELVKSAMDNDRALSELMDRMTESAAGRQHEIEQVFETTVNDIAAKMAALETREAMLEFARGEQFDGIIQSLAGQLDGLGVTRELLDTRTLRPALDGLVTRLLVTGDFMASMQSLAEFISTPEFAQAMALVSMPTKNLTEHINQLNQIYREAVTNSEILKSLNKPNLFSGQAAQVENPLVFDVSMLDLGNKDQLGQWRSTFSRMAKMVPLALIFRRGLSTQSFRELMPAEAIRKPYDALNPLKLQTLGDKFRNSLVIAATGVNFDRSNFSGEGILTDEQVMLMMQYKVAGLVRLVELVLHSDYLRSLLKQSPDDSVPFPTMNVEAFKAIMNIFAELAQTEAARRAVRMAA